MGQDYISCNKENGRAALFIKISGFNFSNLEESTLASKNIAFTMKRFKILFVAFFISNFCFCQITKVQNEIEIVRKDTIISELDKFYILDSLYLIRKTECDLHYFNNKIKLAELSTSTDEKKSLYREARKISITHFKNYQLIQNSFNLYYKATEALIKILDCSEIEELESTIFDIRYGKIFEELKKRRLRQCN